MNLTDTFQAYMKTNTLKPVPSTFGFKMWGSRFHVIFDGKQYGIAEEITGCLISGPHSDPHAAVGSAMHKLRLEYTREKFEKIKIQRVKEGMSDLHE